MKALSIRQPWAWAIIHAGKDIENRSWPTHFRGRFLVHASSRRLYHWQYAEFLTFYRNQCLIHGVEVPTLGDLRLGGIIGAVDLVDCVSDSASPWFDRTPGNRGFVLRNPEPLPFRPYKGKLSFFEVNTKLPEAA